MTISIVGLVNVMMFLILEIYVANKLFEENVDLKKPSNLIVIILYGLYLVINAYMTEKLLKVILTYTVLMVVYKMVYRKDWNKSIMCSFIVHCLIYSSEVIGVTAIVLLGKIIRVDLMSQLAGGIIINLVIAIIYYIIYKIMEKSFMRLARSSENYKNHNSIIIYSILLITASMIINKLNLSNWTLNFEFLINIIIFIVFLAILLYLSNQKQKYSKISEKYTSLSTYSKLNDDLLEEYRIKSHEFSNELAIIKLMNNNQNKELENYLKTLMDKNKNQKYKWLNEVKYIQLAGLKGLINYKIMEMNSLKVKVSINVSKEIKNIKFVNFSEEDKDQLYSIIGVLLDNAKEAALDCKEKKVIIEIYVEDNKMKIIIGNTYNNKVDIDRLGEYRYTTKGKEHGIGLHLVKNIINKNDKFRLETKIDKNYFYQNLTII